MVNVPVSCAYRVPSTRVPTTSLRNPTLSVSRHWGPSVGTSVCAHPCAHRGAAVESRHGKHHGGDRRPPAEVFAFVADPSKLSAWQDAEEVQQLTEGPVGAGMRFREVHKAMGRRRVELTEVVECDPGRLFHIRVVEGPPVDGRWEFAPTPAGGTRVTLTPLAHLPAGRASQSRDGADDRAGVPPLPSAAEARAGTGRRSRPPRR